MTSDILKGNSKSRWKTLTIRVANQVTETQATETINGKTRSARFAIQACNDSPASRFEQPAAAVDNTKKERH
ncbi:MAG: hypothetical protein CMM07_19820 [Rhodopirellula sp.]|nr:hypothetical protein [Rhodopirellula sp.]